LARGAKAFPRRRYWIGGKDHFQADREAAEKVIEVMPFMPLIAQAGQWPASSGAGVDMAGRVAGWCGVGLER
jgi:hypothetical protein